LVVEPMPDYFERLELNYRNYPSIKPVRTALHPSERSATLYRVDPAREAELPSWAAGIASFLPEHHEFLSIPGEYIVEEQVPCVTLMQLLEDEGIDRLDLLQVDTEGFDAVIIRMLDFEKVHPKVIKYEHVNLTPDDRRSTESLLASRGYRSFIEDGDTIAFDQSLEV
jgi:FkbM family methyltransferase